MEGKDVVIESESKREQKESSKQHDKVNTQVEV